MVTFLGAMRRRIGRRAGLRMPRLLGEQGRLGDLLTDDGADDLAAPHRLSDVARHADWPPPAPGAGRAGRGRTDAER